MRPQKLGVPEKGGLHPDLPGRGEIDASLISWCEPRPEGPMPYFPTESPDGQPEFREMEVV